MSDATVDKEVAAMGTISEALAGLDNDDTRARVLRWAVERYGLPVTVSRRTHTMDIPEKAPESHQYHHEPPDDTLAEPVFDHFVDLFDAVDPKTEIDRALTAAYWLQVVSKQASWQALRVNNLLKDTGHGLPNVTAALRDAQRRKPALVRQMAKSGKARQAWKTYKLTTFGVAYIRDKLGLTGAVPAAIADNGEDRD